MSTQNVLVSIKKMLMIRGIDFFLRREWKKFQEKSSSFPPLKIDGSTWEKSVPMKMSQFQVNVINFIDRVTQINLPNV